ncbi:Protein phosphatase methylesterase 1-like protein [Dinothrombium tinctorium]|uniref:Protein phosphatase methylesterase 1 n=1 Tax=Dinothrombium tinctorium TaxID=1965070 RepID=A0A443RBR8_9ACAR|nr:Protein phosphatase methylesterase 1-like protein [Dinothrombium tinctorium]
MSDIRINLLRKSLPPLRPSLKSGRGPRSVRTRDFAPVPYSLYFDEFKDFEIGDDCDRNRASFRVYLSGFGDDDSSKPLLLLLHGGGYSGLTWCLFAKELRQLCHCRLAAIDLRGHGNTVTDDDYDLSVATLCRDVGNVFRKLTENETDVPPVILVGHSMGGALAVHCANNLQQQITTLVGLVVIDVVEGTAMEALKGMQSVLRNRPKSFRSLESAIEWCGMTRNLDAAKVSMPGQLKNAETDKPATEYVHESINTDSNERSEIGKRHSTLDANKILEEENEEETSEHDAKQIRNEIKDETKKQGYVWRIDLEKTEPYWTSWFEGLSELFLNAPVESKLLILAGVDRLDRALMIGVMQGKFQSEVLPRVGHAIHEDDPTKVAELISHFLIYHRIAQPL